MLTGCCEEQRSAARESSQSEEESFPAVLAYGFLRVLAARGQEAAAGGQRAKQQQGGSEQRAVADQQQAHRCNGALRGKSQLTFEGWQKRHEVFGLLRSRACSSCWRIVAKSASRHAKRATKTIRRKGECEREGRWSLMHV